MQKISTQSEWIARAQAVLPASGFGNFDPSIVIARGEGSHIWDEDGKEYIRLPNRVWTNAARSWPS